MLKDRYGQARVSVTQQQALMINLITITLSAVNFLLSFFLPNKSLTLASFHSALLSILNKYCMHLLKCTKSTVRQRKKAPLIDTHPPTKNLRLQGISEHQQTKAGIPASLGK